MMHDNKSRIVELKLPIHLMCFHALFHFILTDLKFSTVKIESVRTVKCEQICLHKNLFNHIPFMTKVTDEEMIQKSHFK
jgi:hypothetical protein